MSMESASHVPPLVHLLEGVHCQRREQVEEAMRDIRALLAGSAVDPRAAKSLPEAIRLLMAHHPELAWTMNPHDRSLPLHHAASLGNVAIANHLLAEYPGAVSMPNKKGKIPLHFAAREGRTEMVRLLLSSDPRTATVQSRKNKLAIHFAAGEGHMSIARQLLEIYPEGSMITSSKGKLPLHFAARWGHLDVARALLLLYPDSVRALDVEGSLPLHDAAREGQIAMAKYLFNIYPRGLMTANIRQEIPLFTAVRRGNLDLVIALVQAWPPGGKYVLKHACIDDSIQYWSRDILELLLRGAVGNFSNCALLEGREAPPLCVGDSAVHTAGDESSDESETSSLYSLTSEEPAGGGPFERPRKRMRYSRVDRGQFLPVHAALSCGANCPILGQVLEKFPDQLSRRDCYGRLPLHVAMTHCRGEEMVALVVEKILKPYPEAANMKDGNGQLPLHVGLTFRAEFGLIKPLLEIDPSCGFTPPGLPLRMAMAHDCDLSTLYELLRGDPSVLSELVRVRSGMNID